MAYADKTEVFVTLTIMHRAPFGFHQLLKPTEQGHVWLRLDGFLPGGPQDLGC